MKMLIKLTILFLFSSIIAKATVINVSFEKEYNDRLIVLKDNPPSIYKNYGDTIFNEFIDKDIILEFDIDEPQLLTLYFPSTNMTEEILVIPKDKLKLEIQEINHQFRAIELSRNIDVSTIVSIKKRNKFSSLYKGNLSRMTKDYNDIILNKISEYYDKTANIQDARFFMEVERDDKNRPYKEFIEFIKNEFKNEYFKEQILLFILEDINHKSEKYEVLKGYYDQILPAILTKNGKNMYYDNLKNMEVLTGESDIDIDLLDSTMSDTDYKLLYVTASWCGPCIEYKDSVIKALELSQSIDNFEMQLFAVENHISDMRKSYDQYNTEDIVYLKGINTNPLGARLNINSVPSLYFIKGKGILKWNWISPFELPAFIRENFEIRER